MAIPPSAIKGVSVNIRVTAETRRRMEEAAARAGLSIGEWVRRLIDAATKKEAK